MTALDDLPARTGRLDMDALDEAAKLGPLFLSDCDDELQIWRESALQDVRRDESGEIVGYRTPCFYQSTDLVAEWDLDGWDEDEGDSTGDETRRKAAEAFVTAVNSLPAMLRSGRDLDDALTLQAEVMREAVRAAVAEGPKAGMDVIVRHVRSIAELSEGLTFTDDMPGGDR